MIIISKICSKCNKQFSTNRSKQLYCCSKCRLASKQYKDYKKKADNKYRSSNKGQQSHLKASRKYNNKNRTTIRKKAREYSKSNRSTRNTSLAKRRASKLNATPNWLTEEQLRDIKLFYVKSTQLQQVTGIKHHVDHIVPLQGKNVSGLHVPWNLRVLTATANMSKGNRLEVYNV